MKMELASEHKRGNLNRARGTWIHFCNLQVGSNNDETVNTNVIHFVTNHACIYTGMSKLKLLPEV